MYTGIICDNSSTKDGVMEVYFTRIRLVESEEGCVKLRWGSGGNWRCWSKGTKLQLCSMSNSRELMYTDV